ncbi:hypothetical protein AB0L06_35335 [Spirillospora sp. NPDC052269]
MRKTLTIGAATAVLGILLSAVPAQAETPANQAATPDFVPCGLAPAPLPVPLLTPPVMPYCMPMTPGYPPMSMY